ncbi:hypothetical protein Tco_0551576 [Tanacetum coccineum]
MEMRPVFIRTYLGFYATHESDLMAKDGPRGGHQREETRMTHDVTLLVLPDTWNVPRTIAHTAAVMYFVFPARLFVAVHPIRCKSYYTLFKVFNEFRVLEHTTVVLYRLRMSGDRWRVSVIQCDTTIESAGSSCVEIEGVLVSYNFEPKESRSYDSSVMDHDTDV